MGLQVQKNMIMRIILFIVSMLLAFAGPAYSQKRQNNDKLMLVEQRLHSSEIEKQALEKVNDSLEQRVNSLMLDLDASRSDVTKYVKENEDSIKEAISKDSPWKVILALIPLLLKFLLTPAFTNMVTRFLKDKTEIGEIIKSFDANNVGAYILPIVSIAASIVVELFFDGPLADFSFYDVGKRFLLFLGISFLLFHGNRLVSRAASTDK